MSDICYKWPALESDPNIFNKYFHEIGLPDIFGFEELITLDYNDVQYNLNELPIFGVIAAVCKVKPIDYTPESIIAYDQIPFYIRQSKELDHACGLIAGLHCLGNTNDIELDESSILKHFFNEVSNKPEEVRTKILEEYNDLKTKHIMYSKVGQTQAEPCDSDIKPDQMINKPIKKVPIHHFISFCMINDNLVELDGTLSNPVIIRNKISSNELLDGTIEEIKKRISNGTITDNISIMYLTYM
jgi:hypothetical protein